MKAIDFILCISFLLSPWIMIGLVVIVIMAVYKRKEKKMYEEQVAFQKAHEPSVIRDSNTVKVEYRMNLMDACIKKNFHRVKSWRVLGDEGAFHPMFWDNNWKYQHTVVIDFLDGTSRQEAILIDPKTDTLTVKPKENKEAIAERAKARIEAIQNMLEMGVPREKILEKYSVEEIEKAEKQIQPATQTTTN